ncbi:hypothetical protein [Bradyrhizobium sp. CCBAU 51753]|uniref:hypothetical protein n=1 Tax=Bradyrhizobium sp. CCBAU 51753 TaxID=1325100 RepID=UPI001889E582|nr:hypothetical protein [Bradyrhizobium sp. CCBAU 51753]QOZ23731.1 hypothetical protein XH93_08855 [Bradyrhizobium sp. CCBAU 51753]
MAKIVDTGQKGRRQVLAVGDVAKVCWRREYVRSAGGAMKCLPGGRVAARLSRPNARVHRRFDTNEPLLSKFGCVGHT